MIQGAKKKTKFRKPIPFENETKRLRVCVCDSHLQSHWWMKTDGNKKMVGFHRAKMCVDTQLLDSFYCLTLRWNDVQIDGQQQERQSAGCRGHHHHLPSFSWNSLLSGMLLSSWISPCRSLWCNKPKKRKKDTREWREKERQSDNWILLMCVAYTIYERETSNAQV